MNLGDKKNYTSKEVGEFVSLIKSNYEGTIADLREQLFEAHESLEEANAEVERLKSQKALISRAITEALAKADDIERVSMIKYNREISQLKAFHDKWQSYYNKIIEKYPLDDELVKTSALNEKISTILSNTDEIDARVEQETKRLRESVATEDEQPAQGGFSFSEALNPKDDLKKIMADLGIIIDDGFKGES